MTAYLRGKRNTRIISDSGPFVNRLRQILYAPGESLRPGARFASAFLQYRAFQILGLRRGRQNRVAGLLEGLRFLRRRGIHSLFCHEAALVRQAAEGLAQLPRVQVYSAGEKGCQSGVLSFRVAGRDPGWVAEELGPGDRGSRGTPLCSAGPCHGGNRGNRHRAGEFFCLQHRPGGGAVPENNAAAGIGAHEKRPGFPGRFSQKKR